MLQEHSSKEEDKPPTAFSAPKPAISTPKPAIAPKKITVLKLRRSIATKLSESRAETAASELDVDLLLSPLEERKVVGGVDGGVVSGEVGGATRIEERKMSIAEMKAEM
jgi:hypothetical protein